jgi:hypothetical protein
MATTSDRRTLVNLAVFAGSAAMFAAAWAGIAQADGDRYVQADVPATAMAMTALQPSISVNGVVPAVDAAQLSTVPAPRRVVIVRRSRPS